LRLKKAKLESSCSGFARRAQYSRLAVQVGGGKRISAIVSTLRPLICCFLGERSSFKDYKYIKNIIDILPPAFYWLLKGL
jgi:hypothetical protein